MALAEDNKVPTELTEDEKKKAKEAKDLEYANIHMNIKGTLTFRVRKNMYHIIDTTKITSVRVESLHSGCSIYLGWPYGHETAFHCATSIDNLPAVVANRISEVILNFLRTY